jgi:molybdopterin synthase catalytic subunit
MVRRRQKTTTGVFPKATVDFGKIYNSFISGLKTKTGSVTSFLGVARLESADGKKKINSLVIESYEKHANQVLGRIAEETKRKYGLTGILIVHALGRFYPGQPVVLVLVASPRRDQAFTALREAVERYKKEPALFKKEIYARGASSWIS